MNSTQLSPNNTRSIGKQPLRRLSRRQTVVISGVAVVAIAVGLSTTFGRSTDDDNANTTAPNANTVSTSDGVVVLPVRTIAAKQVSQYSRARRYTGTIKAARVSELSYKRADRMVEAFFDEGDRVTAGQVLSRIDTRQLHSRRNQISAQLRSAAALLAELIAGPRTEVIDAQRATVAEVNARVRLARAQLARSTKLLDSDAVSRDEFDVNTFGLAAMIARQQAAERTLDELTSGTRKEKVDAQRAEVNRLQATLDELDIEIAESQLLAPFTGVITKRFVDQGTIAPPGTPVFRVAESDKMEAWIGLPVAIANRMQVDDEHNVIVDGQEYRARIRSKVGELDPVTRTATVIFALIPKSESHFLHGQICRIQVSETLSGTGFWVPTSALSTGVRGLWSIFVTQSDGAHQEVARRDVDVIYTEGDRSLVQGTVVEGDQIVLAGTHRLVPGQRVKSLP